MNKLNTTLFSISILFLSACGGNSNYDLGVINNTNHTPVKAFIQYPSPDGMRKIRFSMIEVNEFKSNHLNTSINPVPDEIKINWDNSSGERLNQVLNLSGVPSSPDGGAILITINESSASLEYLDSETFQTEVDKKLQRKGLK